MTDLIPVWLDGELTPFGKLETHLRGLKHKAVSVFVMCGQDILLQRRALGKYHTPGLWANTCCTHPLWGETGKDCAERRLYQELGITGLLPEFCQTLEYRAEVGGGMIEHEVVEVFIATAGKGLKIDPNPDEVMETRWIAYNDLLAEVDKTPEQFTPWIKIYLRDHSASIFGAHLNTDRTGS